VFESLKKKLSDFASLIVKKEKEEEAQPQTEQAEKQTDTQQNPEIALVEKNIEEETEKEKPEKQQKAERKESGEKETARQADITFNTKLKGVLLRKVVLSEKDVAPFLDSLKIDLIKADVNYEVAEKIAENIGKGLIGKELTPGNEAEKVNEIIKQAVADVLSKQKGIDLESMIIESKKAGKLPFKIVFLGPNGAGKTTTIAKVAYMLSKKNISSVISASDTFRAAAIEQAQLHAEKLHIDVVKGKYGADPASVAFDAIAHAKAKGIDCVLIDTAGRQETNKSLLEEVKKIVRVSNPDLVLFVGESIAGNALLDQIRQFNEAVKIDGVILTKLDCDAKGGNTLSVLSETTIPVLYFGTGEKYDDLVPYKAEMIIDSIFPKQQ